MREHKELIKKWLDKPDMIIEHYSESEGDWVVVDNPKFLDDVLYREKCPINIGDIIVYDDNGNHKLATVDDYYYDDDTIYFIFEEDIKNMSIKEIKLATVNEINYLGKSIYGFKFDGDEYIDVHKDIINLKGTIVKVLDNFIIAEFIGKNIEDTYLLYPIVDIDKHIIETVTIEFDENELIGKIVTKNDGSLTAMITAVTDKDVRLGNGSKLSYEKLFLKYTFK